MIERWDIAHSLRANHYSHWGAANLKLKHRITAETPFGGEDTDSKCAKQLLVELADGLEADAVDGYLAGEDRPSTVVERSDVGVSLTVTLTRGTGTRDQDKITAKVKAKTLEEAREDMETLREYVHDLADDARQIQPGEDNE